MDRELLSQIVAFAQQHGGLNSVEADDLRSAAMRGEAFELPQAITPEGQQMRISLSEMIGAALGAAMGLNAVAPEASAPAPTPSISAGDRAIAIRAMFKPEHSATAEALIAANASIEDAAAVARAMPAPIAALVAAHSLPPGYRTIAERAEGMAEFGGSFEVPAGSKEAKAAGWKKAFAKAESGGSVPLEGR